MTVEWSAHAISDLSRLYDFLSAANLNTASRVIRALSAAPSRLLESPRIGERLNEFAPREVRRILVGDYEVRYAIAESTISVLRLWHTREHR